MWLSALVTLELPLGEVSAVAAFILSCSVILLPSRWIALKCSLTVRTGNHSTSSKGIISCRIGYLNGTRLKTAHVTVKGLSTVVLSACRFVFWGEVGESICWTSLENIRILTVTIGKDIKGWTLKDNYLHPAGKGRRQQEKGGQGRAERCWLETAAYNGSSYEDASSGPPLCLCRVNISWNLSPQMPLCPFQTCAFCLFSFPQGQKARLARLYHCVCHSVELFYVSFSFQEKGQGLALSQAP
jgi:hypothetical protein